MWYWIGEGQLPLFLAPAKNLVNRLGQKRLCCSNITSWISTVECTTQYIVKVKSSRQCLLMCTKALHQSQHTPWVKNIPHYQVWNCANMPFLPPYSYELHYCYNVLYFHILKIYENEKKLNLCWMFRFHLLLHVCTRWQIARWWEVVPCVYLIDAWCSHAFKVDVQLLMKLQAISSPSSSCCYCLHTLRRKY